MASDRKPATGLADPSTALVSYLDDLLHTATSTYTDEEETAAVPEPQPVEPDTRALADEALAPDLPAGEPEPEPVVAKAEEIVEPVREMPVKASADAPAREPPAPVEPEGTPEWADRPFECLIFKVAGLQLAVPLVLLGAIHRIDDRIKPIPGRPPWYMGMLLDRNQKLKVVDSAEWIMSGRVPEGAREGYRFVIRLDDSDWALACDEVAESFTLSPDQVRWRTSRSKRPWLAGTVVKHMCALIDVGAMAGLLARAEREQHLDLD
ncbi:chemotaxis protein CheW [Marinobacter zhanjiangensis]|uniref:Chemotaxis protein CheW n=1 Tax=Marinobacter zhanjiangensis TaxID=578215 RepID=A0ABQ3ARL7_9GAMM|nr:chemotaxis protein CheW [Marinobacter zhanjiangensis]GGY63826.1 chemotaxis protein CheW [Marinobacter zhanjiangensis]